MTKVAHLSSVHSARDVRIFQKECTSLVEAGYEVVLITRHDKQETIQGIRIQPVNCRGNRFRRMTETSWRIFNAAWKSRADIYHFHDPELLPVGLLLKVAGKRVIYDAHEHLESDILSKRWIPSALRKAVSKASGIFERFATSQFDGVVAATPFIAECFPGEKTALVQNFPRREEFMGCSTTSPYECRDYTAVYVGSMEVGRGAREIVAAASLLAKRIPSKVVLVGGIDPPEFRNELSLLSGWKHVEHVGFQDRRGVLRYLTSARVGIVVLHPTPGFVNSQPVKLFEYMAAGLPVVASNFPDWKKFVDEIGCGISVDPRDAEHIADAIQWLLEHPQESKQMGERGQEAVRSTYNWGVQARSLLQLYSKVSALNS